ncbi:hypothetical protein BJ138DRAFT_969111, partial [Hygrophoropsis aurantiaca]
HAEWYASMLPGMIPVALLGSAVYMALHFAQSSLAHEKFLDDAHARIRALEAEVESLAATAGSTRSGTDTAPKTGARWW